jgi:hypothetical protein
LSADSYRTAVERYRDALDFLGRYRGPCLCCSGHPDARHRQADAITGALLAGETPELTAEDYLPDGSASAALEVAFACLATDVRLHRITHRKAAALDREVWGNLVEIEHHVMDRQG